MHIAEKCDFQRKWGNSRTKYEIQLKCYFITIVVELMGGGLLCLKPSIFFMYHMWWWYIKKKILKSLDCLLINQTLYKWVKKLIIGYVKRYTWFSISISHISHQWLKYNIILIKKKAGYLDNCLSQKLMKLFLLSSRIMEQS